MILVVGSGVAGLTAAITAAHLGAEVLLATPGTLDLSAGEASELGGGNTALAQGGIAAAVGAGDRSAWHAADTIAAGAGLVDARAASLLCSQGADEILRLIGDGFEVDRRADGSLSLGLEAAHGFARIVHAGEDRTGASLHAFLGAQFAALVRAGRARLVQRATAVSLLSTGGAVTGAVLRDASGALSVARASSVVLATGGYAALFSRTSNHAGARGQGVLLAARVGAVVSDLEFVQFHPTVLAGTGFLISEAVRGAGAVLRDDAGRRFMTHVHEAAELAPRDVVARAVHRTLLSGSSVWLDATAIERESGAGTLRRRFPTIAAATRAQGLDWAVDPVAITPAAHYTMGGVVTDLDGRTSVPGLFAAGEVANTGVHGANRLASNSLLEGLVFGARAAHAAAGFASSSGAAGRWELNGTTATNLVSRAESFAPSQEGRSYESLHNETWASDETWAADEHLPFDRLLGIERDESGLTQMLHVAASRPEDAAELAGLIAQAALARTESRGAHYRVDHPLADDAQCARRSWVLPDSSLSIMPRQVPLSSQPVDSQQSRARQIRARQILAQQTHAQPSGAQQTLLPQTLSEHDSDLRSVEAC